jgi:hypothetical protein
MRFKKFICHNMRNLLYKVISDESAYTAALFGNITALAHLTETQGKRSGLNPIEVLGRAVTLLSQDMQNIGKIMEDLESNTWSCYSFALKTNKLSSLFEGGASLIKASANFIAREGYYPSIELMVNNTLPTYLGGGKDCKGTSLPNAAQVAYITVLRVLNPEEHNITKLTGNIYNPFTSVALHGVSFPKEYAFSGQWFYVNHDANAQSYELLTPTLGYAFGGNRECGIENLKYKGKVFKTHDCSSYVASKLNSTKPFATFHMQQAYQNRCDNEYCKAVLEVLRPISIIDIEPGDVFAWRTQSGGHTGFITKVLNSTCFTTLSFSRDIPRIEGFGYLDYCPCDHRDREHYFFASGNDDGMI